MLRCGPCWSPFGLGIHMLKRNMLKNSKLTNGSKGNEAGFPCSRTQRWQTVSKGNEAGFPFSFAIKICDQLPKEARWRTQATGYSQETHPGYSQDPLQLYTISSNGLPKHSKNGKPKHWQVRNWLSSKPHTSSPSLFIATLMCLAQGDAMWRGGDDDDDDDKTNNNARSTAASLRRRQAQWPQRWFFLEMGDLQEDSKRMYKWWERSHQGSNLTNDPDTSLHGSIVQGLSCTNQPMHSNAQTIQWTMHKPSNAQTIQSKKKIQIVDCSKHFGLVQQSRANFVVQTLLGSRYFHSKFCWVPIVIWSLGYMKVSPKMNLVGSFFFPQFLMSISHETAWPKFWSLVAEKLLVLVLDPELFGWFFHPGLLHLGFGLHLGLLGFHVVDPHRVFQLEHNHPVVRIFQLQNIHVDILGRSNQFKTKSKQIQTTKQTHRAHKPFSPSLRFWYFTTWFQNSIQGSQASFEPSAKSRPGRRRSVLRFPSIALIESKVNTSLMLHNNLSLPYQWKHNLAPTLSSPSRSFHSLAS